MSGNGDTGRYAGRRFYKMSGSGNDFVFFDARTGDTAEFETPKMVQRLCARGTGVGADGVVVLEPTPSGGRADGADVSLRYYNADGSRASLCGNATLCTTNLAVSLGLVNPAGFSIATGAGVVRARLRNGVAEFDLPPVLDAVDSFREIDLAGAEQQLGYATAGVPHVVIRVPDLASCDVVGRGRDVRRHAALVSGANINFVAPGSSADGGWKIRTYERGVEDETLACGTGCAASAILLQLWGEASGDVTLETASGQSLTVSCVRDAATGGWLPSLRGEGRVVFMGELGTL